MVLVCSRNASIDVPNEMFLIRPICFYQEVVLRLNILLSLITHRPVEVSRISDELPGNGFLESFPGETFWSSFVRSVRTTNFLRPEFLRSYFIVTSWLIMTSSPIVS